MGCLFLSSTVPGNIQQLLSRRGKGSTRGSVYFLGRKQDAASARNIPVLLGRGKGPGQAWDGAFWKSTSWKKPGLGDPLEIPPRGKGRTLPSSHRLTVPNSQPGTGAAPAPAGMGDENRSWLLSLWGRLRAFGSTEIHHFSCLAWEHPVLDSSSESARQAHGSALFRNCSASYSGQQFQPWELLTHYPPISALKPAVIPSPTFPISFSS